MQTEHTDSAERNVLGSMIRDENALADVVQILREQDFRMDAHRRIWRALIELFQANKPIDAALLHAELTRRQDADVIGGVGYLAELLAAAPTTVNVMYHARLVRNASLLRSLVHVGQQIAYEAKEGSEEASTLLEGAEKRIFELAELGVEGQTWTPRELTVEALKRIDARARSQRGLCGLSTGFLDLDSLTAGLQEGELTVLAARPSQGKTALGLQIAREVAGQNVGVYFVSLEQSRLDLMDRLLYAESKVDGQRVRRGFLGRDEATALADATEKLRDLPLHIDDRPAQSMLRIAAQARRLKRRHGIGLVVVDYLQLVVAENPKEPRHEQVGGISRRLKALARDLRVPVLALAQLRRAVEDRADQRPRLSDLRESGSIEADADTVLLLHRPKKKDPNSLTDTVEVLVEKQRNGPTGEVTLVFVKKQMRFDNFVGESPF